MVCSLPYTTSMSTLDTDEVVVLICGNCSHEKKMSMSAWLPWKEKREKYGTVLTHAAPCNGTYTEKGEEDKQDLEEPQGERT